MTHHPLPRANDDSAARLLLAEHAEERGDGRMARAWRWMAERDSYTSVYGYWPIGKLRWFVADSFQEIEAMFASDLADALERGEL